MRKELSMHDSTFENEARILSILQRLRNPNILNLVCCYTHQSKHNLISPFIRDGDLQSFLRREYPKDMSLGTLLSALAGLSSAIWALHEFVLDDSEPSMKGNHQDLRPENVLVDGSRFILADFGLSSIKRISANSRTPFKGRKGYCQAPECVDIFPPYQEHNVTRAIDIFSFACIIADVLVHYRKGPSGVQQFRSAREFELHPMCFSLYHKGNRSNEAVAEWLKEISISSSQQALEQVVQLATESLEIQPLRRPNAAMVTAKLCVAAITAFSEPITASFDRLPDSMERKIQQSRFASWLVCQNEALFLSAAGATAAGHSLESTIEILRPLDRELHQMSLNAPRDNRDFIEVRALITQLLNMLPPQRRADSVSHLETSLLAAMDSTSTSLMPESLRAAFGDGRIAEMAETKELMSHLNEVSQFSRSISIPTIGRSAYTKSSHGHLVIAKICNAPTTSQTTKLVETIKYQDPVTGERLKRRLSALHGAISRKALSQQLRLPPFSALCHESGSFSYDILYDYPDSGTREPQANPISLHELFCQYSSMGSPALETRHNLASDLAAALAEFHSLNWFHKDLTPFNIIFFLTADPKSPPQPCNPYLFGFQHSRDATDDFTTGPLQDKKHQRYHHPDYISTENRCFNRFVQRYDWYSLGIVLVEIGFWDSIDSIMGGHTDESNHDFAKIVTEQKLPSLAFYMGRAYADVVKFCLDSSDQCWSDADFTYTQTSQTSSTNLATLPNMVFKNKVVAPLQTLASRYVGQSGTQKRKLASTQSPESPGASKKRMR